MKKIGSHKSKAKPPAEVLTKLYWVSLNRDPNGFDLAIAGLKFSDYQTRRLAAEALGRIGDKRAVPVILKALEDEKNDRVLQHSLTYALIEIGDVEGTREGLKSDNVNVKRSVLMALHNMPNGITGQELKPLLTVGGTNDELLRRTAWWILRKHPELADSFIDFFKARLGRDINVYSTDAMAAYDEEGMLHGFLGAMTENPKIREMVTQLLNDPKLSSRNADDVFSIIRESRLKQTPDEWFDAIIGFLNRNRDDQKTLMIATFELEKLKPGKNGYPQKYIDKIVELGSKDAELSQNFFIALPNQTWTPTDQIFLARMNGLTHSEPDRADSSLRLLEKFKLKDSQLETLVSVLPMFQHASMGRVLSLFDRTRSESVGLALVKALNTPEMRARIRTEQIKPILDKYPEAVKAEAAKLYAELDKARAGEIAKFESLLKELPPGDIRRGQVVFHSQKANCKACHMIGYVGGKVGPDLTKIGGIRTDRDLLESIVFPSASFVRSYEPVRVNTKDGRTFNGNIKSDRPDEVVLVVAADQEVRIARDNIEEIVPGQLSVMPSGLDQQMTKQDLADLVAFLKANK